MIKMFKRGTYLLNENKNLVDSLNVFPVPDGDTGTNMSLTMTSAIKDILENEYETIAEVTKSVSKGSLMGARGNSGVILSQIFRGFAKGCEGKSEISVEDLAHALRQASETAYKAVLKPVEGTILTVIRKTSKRAVEIVESNEDISFNEFFEAVLEKANETLEKTPEYLKVLKQAGVVDAGGKGLICILEGFREVISGKDVSHTFVAAHKEAVAKKKIDHEEIKFTYCTEFILRSGTFESDELRKQIETLGDSMVFVEDDGIVKIHIHTNEPNRALGYALKHGDLINIKIENMKEQHENVLLEAAEEDVELNEFGFISVAMGKGIANIFEDLNVDHIIEGGQTMNPSTEDIVNAIEKVPAKNVFIFPNNSNIILAANQAKDISDKNVFVIPSKSIPQGIAAMLEYNPEDTALGNFENMTSILPEIKTVQVTYSVRDTVFDDKAIKEGDILGVAEGDIAAVGQDVNEIALETLAKVVDEEEIITVYYGEGVSKEMAEEFVAKIEDKFDDVEVEMYYGEQPLYYYIISAE